MSKPAGRISERGLFLGWLTTFLAFPLGGIASLSFVGPVEGVVSAALAGALAGAFVGAGQWLALYRHLGAPVDWILATTVGLALGATIGAILTDAGRELQDLLVFGLVSGAAVGVAQWPLLRQRLRYAALWPPVVAAGWVLGWLAAEAAGVELDNGYVVFDPVGGLGFSAITGAMLLFMIRSSHATTLSRDGSADTGERAEDER